MNIRPGMVDVVQLALLPVVPASIIEVVLQAKLILGQFRKPLKRLKVLQGQGTQQKRKCRRGGNCPCNRIVSEVGADHIELVLCKRKSVPGTDVRRVQNNE